MDYTSRAWVRSIPEIMRGIDTKWCYTEGDVEGIMDRPIGDAPDVQAEREKW